MLMGYIYKIINTQSDKIYVGQTAGTLEKRFEEHKKQARLDNQNALYCAMRKYGINNFSIILIEECDNDLLNTREKYWINYYNSFNHGYNMTIGGEGRTKYNYKEIADKYLELKSEKQVCNFFNCTEYVVQKACESFGVKIKKGLTQDYWNSEKGQKHKEQIRQLGLSSKGKIVFSETRKKQSKAKRGKYVGKNSPMYGKSFSKEHREKLSQNSAWAKKVRRIETGEIYASACKAAKAVNLKSSSGISKCCIGQQKTAGGFHWMFIKEGENNY